jgi:3-mercaptopyruvate sulfurtransferase SseA
MGYRNQRVLDEGLPGWEAKGYPTAGSSESTADRKR